MDACKLNWVFSFECVASAGGGDDDDDDRVE